MQTSQDSRNDYIEQIYWVPHLDLTLKEEIQGGQQRDLSVADPSKFWQLTWVQHNPGHLPGAARLHVLDHWQKSGVNDI
jgi:hypothetical protein